MRYFIALLLLTTHVFAQEFNSKVIVNSNRIASSINKKIFVSLQNQLINFINNRRWTSDKFQVNEKIVVNFFLNLESVGDDNVYQSSLIIQLVRPIYNTNYNTPLLTLQDADFAFKYIEFQPLLFDDTKIQGNDANVSNLTAVFSYYLYILLGLDYDSYGLNAGQKYFQKALFIVNNAPESSSIKGWKSSDGIRNRFWLVDNLTNNTFSSFHDIFYNYHRLGLDKLITKDDEARSYITTALNNLKDLNKSQYNSMIVQTFLQTKSSEITSIYKNATKSEKTNILQIMSELDPSNTKKYSDELGN